MEWVDRGDSLVTRTERLARDLRTRIALLRGLDGCTVAESPRVEVLDRWLQGLWESAEAFTEAGLLAPTAESVLWGRIVEEDVDGSTILDIAGLARSAAEAWRLTHRWNSPDWEAEVSTDESQAFRRWSTRMREHLTEKGWITMPELPDRLAVLLASEPAAASIVVQGMRRVVLMGFERGQTTADPSVTSLGEPAIDRLRAALAQHDISVEYDDILRQDSAIVRVRDYATATDEVRAVATRIRDDLAAQPDIRVGVVACDFDLYRPLIERIFTEELDAPSALPSAWQGVGHQQQRCFDVARGPRLSDHSLIAHALDLLALRAGDNPFVLLSRVLLAPYPRGGADVEDLEDWTGRSSRAERDGRGLAEVSLRDNDSLAATLDQLAKLAEAHGAAHSGTHLKALQDILGREPSLAVPSRWAEQFSKRLDAAGWPGTGIDANEGVAFARWREALRDLAALDPVLGELRGRAALDHLRRLCAERHTQAGSAGLQIQAMGLFDSTGLLYDRIYCMGMTDIAVPRSPRPSPLLPVPWQRRAEVPRSSPELELELAQRLWDRLCHSTAELHASFPRVGKGDEPLCPSPLLYRAPADEDHARNCPPWYAAQSEDASLVEDAATTDVGPALVLKGGTGLLSAQAACPFQALAARRLAAEPLRPPEPRPDPRTRGDLLHRALEIALKRVADAATLAGYDDAALLSLGEVVAAEVMDSYDRAAAVPEGLRSAAQQWLAERVRAWLVFERDRRSTVWSVESTEERIEHELDGGLRISGRIDRTDSVDGALWVLDYKTGVAQKPSAWSGPRMTDPQLPFYVEALRSSGRPVGGVAFADLNKRDKPRLHGRASQNADGLTGMEPAEWGGLLQAFSADVNALAAAYVAGDATVSPVDARTCTNCGRQALCRVFELSDPFAKDHDDEESA